MNSNNKYTFIFLKFQWKVHIWNKSWNHRIVLAPYCKDEVVFYDGFFKMLRVGWNSIMKNLVLRFELKLNFERFWFWLGIHFVRPRVSSVQRNGLKGGSLENGFKTFNHVFIFIIIQISTIKSKMIFIQERSKKAGRF